jgi:hypothetical protein
MHMKTLGSSGKHPRSRPLPGPQANPRENALVASYKFAKESAVKLRINFSRENFYAWNPSFLDVGAISGRTNESAYVYAPL